MITVPDDFGAILGEEAHQWRATLPALATKFCARWRLTPDGDLLNGNVAVVLPVRRTEGFISFVLGFLDDAEVLGPAELRDELVDWLRATAHGGAA